MTNLEILQQLLNGNHLEPAELLKAEKIVNNLQLEIKSRNPEAFQSSKVTINNNCRMYQVVTSTGHQAFCNIEDLNRIVKNLGTNPGYFKIYHFWNNKPEKLSKKTLDEMFDGSQLKREFNY